MQVVYADLHVHIGRSSKGKPVKMAASPRLTLDGIVEECTVRKGIGMVGIIDAVCTPVFEELQAACDRAELVELEGGGLGTPDGRLTVILGAELEVQTGGRAAHYLAYLPTMQALGRFRESVAPYITNPALSSQVVRLEPGELLEATVDSNGLFILAHAFTPHKGYYGNCADSLRTYFTGGEIAHIAAVELGLSSDTAMADRISELHSMPYVSNSDAHSLENIAREYNELRLREPTFAELALALRGRDGRGIIANYGLDPRLGKYHRTYCPSCEAAAPLRPDRLCERCGARVVTGVYDRLMEIADTGLPADQKPPYVHQVPLRFVPGLGPKGIQRLLERFGTHMHILHQARIDEMAEVVGERVATLIEQARRGEVRIRHGAGGHYGKFEG